MTSESKELQADKNEISATLQANANTAKIDQHSSSIETRLDKIEGMIEEVGLAHSLQTEMKDYIIDLKGEVKDIRNYRFWTTVYASLVSFSLFALLLHSMIMEPNWFMKLNGKLQVTLLTTLGGGSIFVLSILLRGVYRSRTERHEGGMLPESLKVALESYRGIQNR